MPRFVTIPLDPTFAAAGLATDEALMDVGVMVSHTAC